MPCIKRGTTLPSRYCLDVTAFDPASASAFCAVSSAFLAASAGGNAGAGGAWLESRQLDLLQKRMPCDLLTPAPSYPLTLSDKVRLLPCSLLRPARTSGASRLGHTLTGFAVEPDRIALPERKPARECLLQNSSARLPLAVPPPAITGASCRNVTLTSHLARVDTACDVSVPSAPTQLLRLHTRMT